MKQCTVLLLCAWLMWSQGTNRTVLDNVFKEKAGSWELYGAYPPENGYSLCNVDTKTYAENAVRAFGGPNKVNITAMIGGGHMVSYSSGGESYFLKFQCFPDTVKP